MIPSFLRRAGIGITEGHAFPAALANHVRNSAQLLARGQVYPPSKMVISVFVGEELLNIPYRVYCEKQPLLEGMHSPGEIGLISLCLGTRHHDGFLREQCLRRLLARDESWTAPFVIQLLGEYVIEVIQPIHERFVDGVERKYLDFFRQNPKYCEYLEHRAISYWNEYYRARFLKYKDYPAVQALAALKAAAEPLMVKPT